MKRKDIESDDCEADEVLMTNESATSTTGECVEPKLKQQRSTSEMDEGEDEDESMDTITTHKTEKYDRQIRLWGVDGQKDLENANICLINVTALGTEILKCLVLPGIGRFTIIDQNIVTTQDLGSNFFLDPASIGKSKAQSGYELLQELNPDTEGKFIAQDPMELLESNPQLFADFTIVICSRLCERDLIKLGDVLWRFNVPLVVCDSYAFTGYMRPVLKEHIIVNAKPDNLLEDLRLDHTFPELEEYMAQIDLKSMDKLQHSHTPYIVLLYKYLQEWRAKNNCDWPKSYAEKREIRDAIRGGILENEHGVREQEENFEEAIRNCNSAFTKTRIPSEVSDILNKSLHVTMSKDLPQRSAKFWVLVKALKQFVDVHGVLPIRGTLPDMFSDSQRYIQLQNIYKTLASRNVDEMNDIVLRVLDEHSLPRTLLTSADVATFCKHSFFLRNIDGLSLHEEMSPNTNEKLKETLESAIENNGADMYIVTRAINRFYNSGRYPFSNSVGGEGSNDDAADMQQLLTLSEQLIKELGVSGVCAPSKYFEELRRCGGVCDVHLVASILGGMCAQEVIKLVTRQFVPVDNFFFFDAMNEKTVSLKL